MAASKYNETTVSIIMEALLEGKGRMEASRLAGIDYGTFVYWMDNKPEFKEKIDAILGDNSQLAARFLAMEALLKAFKKDWRAAAWWLERNYPEEFAIGTARKKVKTPDVKMQFKIGGNGQQVKQIEMKEKAQDILDDIVNSGIDINAEGPQDIENNSDEWLQV